MSVYLLRICDHGRGGSLLQLVTSGGRDLGFAVAFGSVAWKLNIKAETLQPATCFP